MKNTYRQLSAAMRSQLEKKYLLETKVLDVIDILAKAGTILMILFLAIALVRMYTVNDDSVFWTLVISGFSIGGPISVVQYVLQKIVAHQWDELQKIYGPSLFDDEE